MEKDLQDNLMEDFNYFKVHFPLPQKMFLKDLIWVTT